jgi:hypothetical protein
MYIDNNKYLIVISFILCSISKGNVWLIFGRCFGAAESCRRNALYYWLEGFAEIQGLINKV